MKSQAGAIAQQQALVLVFGLSYRKAAKVAGVHHRNLWSHVAAKPGSNVASWESRPAEIKREAVKNLLSRLVKDAFTSHPALKIEFDFSASQMKIFFPMMSNGGGGLTTLSFFKMSHERKDSNTLVYHLPEIK